MTYASAIVDPPAARFRYRVCLNPAWEAAMGVPAAHGPCPAHGFHLPAARASSHRPRARAAFEFGGEGRGTPLAPFPSPAAIAAARHYLEGRAGRTAFAVVDSAGRLAGWNTRAHFQSASVVKVMFLTAYLQMLVARHRALGPGDRALLYPMIHESNNEDASAVLAAVGGAAVARVAREAGMEDYAPGVGWWAYTQTSAADQARFFTRLGALIPARYYGYARYLMSTIEPEQSWGVPVVARPAGACTSRPARSPRRVCSTRSRCSNGVPSPSPSRSSPTATPRRPTAKKRSPASARGCWAAADEPARARRATRPTESRRVCSCCITGAAPTSTT